MHAEKALNPATASMGARGLPLGRGSDAAINTAAEAFELMQLYQTPPIPEAYEIFYTLACHKPKEIVRRIEEAASATGVIDLHDIHEIHNDLFSYPEALRNHHESTNEKLDGEMNAVLDMVHTYMKRNTDYCLSLDQASEELASASSPQALRKTVEMLLTENEKSREESQRLATSLEVSQSSIRDMRDQLAKAREDGLRDALTRLHNRRHFDSVLRTEIDAAHTNHSPLSLVMVDVDHFKKVNDTFGHPAGDAVLRVLGRMLAENVKGRDIPARYGGEEFAIILPETKLVGATTLANEIRRQLERKKLTLRDTSQDIGTITASFGVSELREGDTAQSLIARTDKMLYQAKNTGRNKVVSDGET